MTNELRADYLYKCYQCVKIDDEFSNALQISTGVPQGSILGPLLCILYVLPSFLTYMYGDYTTLVGSDTVYIILANVWTRNLIFQDWALANRSSINVDKTFRIIFGNRSVDIGAPNFVLGNVLSQNEVSHLIFC